MGDRPMGNRFRRYLAARQADQLREPQASRASRARGSASGNSDGALSNPGDIEPNRRAARSGGPRKTQMKQRACSVAPLAWC